MGNCVVIGAGLIGMLTARELAANGFNVTVLERGEAGRESSWAGGGILSPLYPWRYPEAVSRLAIYGHQHYQALAEALHAESGIDPEWTQSGLLVLDTGEKEECLSWSGRYSMSCELIHQPEIHKIEPALVCPEDQKALWMPHIGQVRNPRFVQSLKKSVLDGKIQLVENKEVISVQSMDGRVTGVDFGSSFLAAERVVVAGGAWSARILESLGVTIKVEPVRGQMILFKTNPGMITRIILNKGHYLIPRRDGHVLMGSTLEYVGFEKKTTDEAMRELYQLAIEMVPDLSNCEVVKHWAGLRPGTPDGVPYIGEVPGVSGLYLNTGHFRNGVILAPGSVRLLVDLMLGRETIFDAFPYSVSGHGA